MQRLCVLVLACVLTMLLPGTAQAVPAAGELAISGSAERELTVLVTLAPDHRDVSALASDHLSRLREDHVPARLLRSWSELSPGYALALPAAALPRLRALPGVTRLETSTPLAATGELPAGLDRIDQRRLPLSRSFAPGRTGRGVRAYVVDSGLRLDHREFTGRVRPGPDFVDGGLPEDCHGHGTHVAGTLAGSSVGVAPGAQVVPVRVLGCDGTGSELAVIEALEFVAADHEPDVPALVVLSLAGAASPTLDDAVAALTRRGVLVVTGAGNTASDACQISPARAPEALTVAASDPRTDARWSSSNFGSCVDLFAPGVGISSASTSAPTAYASWSGTSMSAPHVAGAAALLLQAAPRSTPAALQAALLRDATPSAISDARSSTAALLHIPHRLTLLPRPGCNLRHRARCATR